MGSIPIKDTVPAIGASTPRFIVFAPRVVTAAEIDAAQTAVGLVASALDVVERVRPNLMKMLGGNKCPDVQAVYVDRRRMDPETDGGKTAAEENVGTRAGLSPSIAATLRRISAGSIAELRYVDCAAPAKGIPYKNVLWITTRQTAQR